MDGTYQLAIFRYAKHVDVPAIQDTNNFIVFPESRSCNSSNTRKVLVENTLSDNSRNNVAGYLASYPQRGSSEEVGIRKTLRVGPISSNLWTNALETNNFVSHSQTHSNLSPLNANGTTSTSGNLKGHNNWTLSTTS